MKEYSDAELVKMIVESDSRDAFAELVQRYQRPVFGILHKILGNSREIEDVAQDVFLALYRNLRHFRQEAQFSTWLYRVAYNHGCSAMRHKKSKKIQMLDNSLEREDGSMLDIADTDGSETDQRILAQQVWQLVETLPVQSRVVIELFYRQEKSYAEIVEITSLPVGTVKTHLFRARAELRERVANPEAARSLS